MKRNNDYSLFIVLCAALICACRHKPAKEHLMGHKAREEDIHIIDSKENAFKSPYDTLALMRFLFNPIKIVDGESTTWPVNEFKKTKVAVWKPDADAKFNMNISEDGNCYTNIDTVIKVSEGHTYLVVFTTMIFDPVKMEWQGEGHCCGADYGCARLEKVDSVYRIKAFQKNFAVCGFGFKADSVALTDAGNNYLLYLMACYVGGGAYFKTASLYSIDDFSKVFSYQPDRMNSNTLDTVNVDETEQSISFAVDKTDSDHYLLKLITNHEITDSTTNNKTVTKKTVEYYRMNDMESQYEKVRE